MSGLAFEDPLAANDPDDPLRKSERRPGAFEHRALLDVHFEEAFRQVALLDEGRAADATTLLVAEHNRGALAHALDRLDRGDDAERPVELPAARD